MPHDTDIRVLNDLVEVTLASADGYHGASDRAKDPSLKALFVARATERRAIVADLQAQVRRLGSAPEDEGSVLARAHRTFLGLEAALGGGTGAVLSEVERGEDHIKRRYEDALAERGVSLDVQNAIQTHYATIRGGHDRIRALRNAAE